MESEIVTTNDQQKQLVEKENINKKALNVPRPSPMGGFNAEELLALASVNERVNNILRSPRHNPSNCQRSAYTSPRFNAGAAPFVSRRERSQSTMNISSHNMDPNETYTPTRPMRQPRVHMNESSMHRYGSYETSQMGYRGGGAPPQGDFNDRYQDGPPSNYGFDDTYRMPHTTLSTSQYAQQFPRPLPPPPYTMGRLSGNKRGVDNFNNHIPSPCPGTGPIAMANGTIQLRLRDGVRIDMTLDKAVRILNQRSMVAVALSNNGSSSAIIHPNGRVLQSGSKVEIVAYDGMKSNNYVRYAKMWYKGISFTSETLLLIYLVDTAGTRTTTDNFTDLTNDFTLNVFYENSRHGPSFVQEANEVIQNMKYNCTVDGTETYDINGFHVTQAADGLVRLTRNQNKCLIRTSPGNGSATLTTLGIHCTASLGKTSHLFVRRNEKRMHFDGSCFIVRNAGHSAGFNENNLLIVY